MTKNHNVVANYTNRDDESGFSGTLFQNKDTNEYVIAMRGTEVGYQDLIVVDIGNIVNDGLAHHHSAI